jgi:hypothetical protein
MPPLLTIYTTHSLPSSARHPVVVEVEAVVAEVVAEAAEVVVEEYLHLDHPKQPGKMCPHHEVKLKLWDNSHESSQEIEARPTTSLTNFAATYS